MATETATTQTLAGRSSEAAVRNGCTMYTPMMIRPPLIRSLSRSHS
jgi:hypothetical protein